VSVHIAGDVLFYTLIWPHDARRPRVSTNGVDATFWTKIPTVTQGKTHPP